MKKNLFIIVTVLFILALNVNLFSQDEPRDARRYLRNYQKKVNFDDSLSNYGIQQRNPADFSLKSTVCGVDTFTTTATADTVVISGAKSTDYYFLSPRYVAGVDQQDVLEWTAKTDTLIVNRLAAGESGLIYAWQRISP